MDGGSVCNALHSYTRYSQVPCTSLQATQGYFKIDAFKVRLRLLKGVVLQQFISFVSSRREKVSKPDKSPLGF